jgi:tetratricopeptide (TPR) repeat protein
MFEHVDDGSSGVLASFSGIKLPLSEEARASLAAVRAAQEAARLRARRETVRTRLWFGAIVAAIAVAVVVIGPRAKHAPAGARRMEAAVAGSAAAASDPASTRTSTGRPLDTPQPGSGAGVPDSLKAPVAAAGAALSGPAVPAASAPGGVAPEAASAASATENPETVAACGDTFRERKWRLSIEACTQAFAARPKDAGLALKVAKSYYARARGVEAGQWASKAIALDPTLAEAFVLVARADGKAGETGRAVEAYRRYLALAPRGWHAPEARAAVRAHRRDEQRPSHAEAHARPPAEVIVPAPSAAEGSVDPSGPAGPASTGG